MNDYKKLSIRYLQMNKKRTMLTIAGVSVAVTILFAMLNLGLSWVLHYREQIREENNYEIVLFTENKEKIEQIIADSRVKDAYIGNYYYIDYGYDYDETKNKLYSNALYINTGNPYKMNDIMDGLKADYGVEGEENTKLAVTYFNGGNANTFVVIVLFMLLVCYIFAIFGVGIIRNSIQLSTLEQIKDYGNLRCIGASKGQLKTFIYLEGFIMEVSGIIIGVLFGTGLSVIAGYFMKMKAGFHFLPVLLVVAAFLFDLYFAMQENCKVVVHMTPISAVRGEFRIRKEKIKVRKSGLFGKLFGVEGDYAYKNIMRSPGRFYKTVFAMGIGLAALIVGGGIGENMKESVDSMKERYGYYQMFFESHGNFWNTAEEMQSALPPMENMEGLSKAGGVAKTKRLYSADVMMAGDSIIKHYSRQFSDETGFGYAYTCMWQRMLELKEDEDSKEEYMRLHMRNSKAVCYGYDKEDFARYKTVLVDGTLDVSDHGLVLVNGGMAVKLLDDDYMGIDYTYATMTDFKVGDAVKIVDMKKLRERVKERIAGLKTEKQEGEKPEEMSEKKEETDKQGFVDEDADTGASVDNRETDKESIAEKICKIGYECWQELIAEGMYETYTIEGIVSKDINHIGGNPVFVLPLENYFELTGTTQNDNNGMQYHIEQYPYNENLDQYTWYDTDEQSYDTDAYSNDSNYTEEMEYLKNIRFAIYAGIVFILFIVSMSGCNIINTTASNIHLRRKELAQLRVIGVSKKRLMRMVLLEGVITAIVANIVGLIIGGVIGYMLSWFIRMLTGVKYNFPVLSFIVGIFMSLILLCGSIYFPLKGLKQDIAADLVASGE